MLSFKAGNWYLTPNFEAFQYFPMLFLILHSLSVTQTHILIFSAIRFFAHQSSSKFKGVYFFILSVHFAVD